LGLPSGYGEYEIPLILESKSYTPEGILIAPGAANGGSPHLNIIHVNGKTWPYFKVEARKYRFRILDATISRTFELFLSQTVEGTKIPFQVVSADSGLLTEPVTTSTLSIGMAERYDIVVDFAPLAGQNITLRNTAAASTVFDELNNIVRFVVEDEDITDPSTVPATLRTLPVTPPSDGTVAHSFRFANTAGRWTINEVGFSDPARVLANVPRGTVEIWEFQHLGGPTHPIHVHLVDFHILSRTGGTRSVEPYEEKALKDVVWLGAGETIRIEAWYAPWAGLYMFHCHNMLHEDNEMMAAFNVTELEDLGYPETSFADPMEERWRAVAFDAEDFEPTAIQSKIEEMALLQPYNNIVEVEEAINDFFDYPEEASRVEGPSAVKARRISRIERTRIAV
jgi:FtsP/CotA-like multicopper oxidase with cupredoxin domain